MNDVSHERIGVALSGGGARGAMHIGVLKALDEMGVKISMLSGSSSGAFVAGLYASGYAPEEILSILSSISIFKSVSLRPSWQMAGFLKMNGFKALLHQYLKHDFSMLKYPLVVVATDIQKGLPVYFRSGDLIYPILASCSIPAIFYPIDIDGNQYVDGGLVDNLPVRPLQKEATFIVGVHCNSIDINYMPPTVKSIIDRSLLLAIRGNTLPSKAQCDVCIEPPDMDRFGVFDIGRAQEIFDYAYQFTKDHFSSHDFSHASSKDKRKQTLK